jgi:hypothetical protein
VKRKRVAHVYGEFFLRKSSQFGAMLAEIIQGHLLPLIWEHHTKNKSVEVVGTSLAYGLDFIFTFTFGLPRGTNFLENTTHRKVFLDLCERNHPGGYSYWLHEHPHLVKTLTKLKIFIVPKWYYAASSELEEWVSKLVDEAEEALQAGLNEQNALPGHMPLVYFHQKLAMAEELELDEGAYFHPTPQQRLELASECLDHICKYTATHHYQ